MLILFQFNKANGIGTPGITPRATPRTGGHKRSKTLGESIKRIVGRNHKRRPSGHSTNVNAVSPSIQTRHTSPLTPKSYRHPNTPKSSKIVEREPVKMSTASLPEHKKDTPTTIDQVKKSIIINELNIVTIIKHF